MKLKYCLLAMLLFAFKLSAQTSMHALSVGDAVPDVKLANIVNYKSSTAQLSNFKNKLVIIDFWATWCTNCLHNFPLLDSLQQELKDSMQVLLVNSTATTDDEQKITHTFSNIKKARQGEFILPSVIYDSMLDKLFPHTALPHYVWLYHNRVVAITGSKEVNVSNIHLALNNNLPGLRIKNDAADTVTNLYAKEEAGKIIYGSAFTLFDSLKNRKQGVIATAGNKTFYFFNTPVINLYEDALQQALTGNFLLNVADSAKYFMGNEEWDEWEKTNTYCYQLTVPKTTSANQVSAIMLQDINRYLGLNGRFEKRINPATGKPHEVFVLSEDNNLINH